MKGFDRHEMATALADAINEQLKRPKGELPTAIVVMTDGLDNASQLFDSLQDAARECRARGVPLHIYGVGSAEASSLRLKDVRVSETLFSEDTIVVPVRFSAQGFKSGSVEISLTLNGEKVILTNGRDTEDVPLRTDKIDKEGQKLGDNYEKELTFTLPRAPRPPTRKPLRKRPSSPPSASRATTNSRTPSFARCASWITRFAYSSSRMRPAGSTSICKMP